MFKRSVVSLTCLALLTACGGGGYPTPTPMQQSTQTPSGPQSTGDMLALQSNRGWNYQGTLTGETVTLTLYADPSSNGTTNLVLFGLEGTATTAFGGTKFASAMFASNSSGYDVLNATLYNDDGSVYGSGTAPANTLLVASTLYTGAVSTPYAGVGETVTTIGIVPGESACPTPTTAGATINYAYAGQTYEISYVPGCGVTQFTGGGSTLTLTSIGSYPSEGTQAVARNVTMLDTLVTIGRLALVHGSASKMPDVYDTDRYGKSVADLTGSDAGANSRTFAPDAALSRATRGDGAIAFIEKQLAAAHTTSDARGYALANGKPLDDATYDRYACAFGVSVTGSGTLEHARNIGQEWIAHALRACAQPRSYVALHDLAREAVARLTP